MACIKGVQFGKEYCVCWCSSFGFPSGFGIRISVFTRPSSFVISMPDPAPSAQLLRSLARLVRGLSALFWGLPAALIVCYYTATAEGPKAYAIVPPLAVTGLLVYGLWQLGGFQKQERVWRNALDRARVLGLINFGLSPFLYWWNRIPSQRFFLAAVFVMALSGLLFLGSINLLLKRLRAILPDESLRLD